MRSCLTGIKMTRKSHDHMVEEILALIDSDKLTLPTIPEVAIKLQGMIDNPNVSANEIVQVLSSSAAATAHLIKSANSAIYGGMPYVEDVQSAVSRLGYKVMYSIVLSFTMANVLHARNPLIKRHMEEFLAHSREVAAVSYVLSTQQNLNPDRSMLAGLVHDIGTIPLCMFFEQNVASIDEETIEILLRKFQITVGEKLLKNWNFKPYAVNVVTEHNLLQRDSSNPPSADYTDIVTVAHLLSNPYAKFTDWSKVSAAKRMGLGQEDCRTFQDQFSDQLNRAREMLGISIEKKPPNRQEQVLSIPASPMVMQHAKVRQGSRSCFGKYFGFLAK